MLPCSGGQTSAPGSLKTHRASAVVAVVIIVPITPTAPAVASAITMKIVVLWILSRFNVFQNYDEYLKESK
jgi:hypothetical protein